jgi:hypothetical protein
MYLTCIMTEEKEVHLRLSTYPHTHTHTHVANVKMFNFANYVYQEG